jgi:hypothetical protein
MIAGIFHVGSGLGNMLHRYVGTRVLALDKGETHGMVAPELFKGASFMNLDITPTNLEYRVEYPAGKVVVDDPKGITIVDGEFQAEKDFMHRIDEVREWLKVEPLDMPDDLCIIGFRGGEYVGVRDLFLPQEYWDDAIANILATYPHMRFQVHTDDPETAQRFFPDYECIHDIGLNWRSVRYAKHLIIANSSFYILPALLGDAKEIIAPLHWAGYNVGEWRMPDNEYSRFIYV